MFLSLKLLQCQPSYVSHALQSVSYAQNHSFWRLVHQVHFHIIVLNLFKNKREEKREQRVKFNVNIHACVYERHLYVVFLIRCHQSLCMLKSVEISCFRHGFFSLNFYLCHTFTLVCGHMYKSIDLIRFIKGYHDKLFHFEFYRFFFSSFLRITYGVRKIDTHTQKR